MTEYSGLAIAIAWPEFIGKQSGAWYDTPMRWLGANRNFHYKVGHAALILVNKETGSCHHFDCGRYHAPYQYGRIRDATTDDNLAIQTKARISGNRICNFQEITMEIQNNKASFGVGKLYAAYCPLNFELAWARVKKMQSVGAIPFGPFVRNGTNCCRFVRSGILAGLPPKRFRFKLQYLWPFKPMPISNINCLSGKMTVPEVSAPADRRKYSTPYTKENVRGTLPEPVKPAGIPPNSQWLSGEVAGSWFSLEPVEEGFNITRFSSDGDPECNGIFKTEKSGFDVNKPFHFTHFSHCSKVTVIQEQDIYEFSRIPGQ